MSALPTQTQAPKSIVVVGAGVIGLSTALCLQNAGYRVAIIARDFPEPFEVANPALRINYTSQWAGAHNRWVPASAVAPWEARDHRFARVTYTHMQRVAALDSAHIAGVSFVKGEDHLEMRLPEYDALTEEAARELGMTGFRRVPDKELPEGVVWACEYDTWCISPMMYLAYLTRRLGIAGAVFVQKNLQQLDEAFAWEDRIGTVAAVVNCSGWGFGDPKVYAIRGQTAVVSNPCSKTITRQCKDGSWTFCIPRNFSGGTIIGGTKQPHNWDPRPCPNTRAKLLRTFSQANPDFVAADMNGPLQWVRDIVGRRPACEGGMRLEVEVRPLGKQVIHAYGMGGRGYELSWGVAEAVTELVKGLAL